MQDTNSITLKLPCQDRSELSLFAATEDSAQAWISELPAKDISQLTDLLVQALDDLNRTHLSAETRYTLLDTLYPSIDDAVTALSKRFLNQPLIMPSTPRAMAALSNRLCTLAATGYALAAVQAIRGRDSIQDINPARLACQAIQRALLLNSRRILCTLQLTMPMEEGCWEMHHQLYALAEYQGLTALPITKPLSGGPTIRAGYIQGLLLSCCKPNQLRQSDMSTLHRCFRKWGNSVDLKRQESGEEVYLVDLQSDKPPQYRALYREEHTADCRALDCASLLNNLNALQKRLQAGEINFDRETGITGNLLQHVIKTLGSPLMRNFRRTASNSPLWICLGLNSAHSKVSLQHTLEHGLPEGSTDQGPFSKQESPFVEPIDTARVYEVQLADASANGYCLEWTDMAPGDALAGDIVGVKEDKKHNDWAIAVIRWLSRRRNAKTLMGLELLSPRAIACGASLRHSDAENSPLQRVLLLPEIKIVGQPQTLITPRASFKERQKLILHNNQAMHTIQLLRQLSSTGGFEQFAFRYIRELGDVLNSDGEKQKTAEFDSLWNNI